jgi:hypothetical protein
MTSGSVPGRLLATTLPLLSLTACPQLLSDDFYLQLDAGGSDASPGPARDASVDPRRDASSPSGAGGSSSQPGSDAGDAGDAGSTPLTPTQVALRAALTHRYRFDASDPLIDSLGGPSAASVGATFSGGAAVLAGTGSGQYIDLPNGMLAGLSNASFEIWVTWDVTDPSLDSSEWQRIFDLGRNETSSENTQVQLDANGIALFLTPRTSGGKLEVTCEECPNARVNANSLPVGTQVQLVSVLNDDANLMSVYQNGALVGSVSFTGSLSAITNCTARPAPCDWNNWLGRSQHIEDPPFKGRILDFRVYAAALDESLVEASFNAGPDADW